MIFEDDDFVYYYKHLRSSNGSRAVISEGTISFTNPSKFNDPFDCKYGVDDSYFPNAGAVKELFVRQGVKPDSPAKRIQQAKKIKRVFRSSLEDESYFLDINKRIGICCLNQNPLSVLMWSHYADYHKGFMVELKFPKKVPNGLGYEKFVPIEVIYSHSYPKINASDREKRSMVDKAYYTKSIEWSYEKEFRVVNHNISKNIDIYPRNQMLTSVIAGVSISEEDFSLLKLAVKKAEKDLDREIPIYRATKVQGKYEITVPKHPRLDRNQWTKR